MKVVRAPEACHSVILPSLFLAGSIEQGRAENWQRGNVEIVTLRAGFPLFETFDDLRSSLLEYFRKQEEIKRLVEEWH